MTKQETKMSSTKNALKKKPPQVSPLAVEVGGHEYAMAVKIALQKLFEVAVARDGMTVTGLAEILGCDKAAVSRQMSDDHLNLTVMKVGQIVRALGARAEDPLFCRFEDMPATNGYDVYQEILGDCAPARPDPAPVHRFVVAGSTHDVSGSTDDVITFDQHEMRQPDATASSIKTFAMAN